MLTLEDKAFLWLVIAVSLAFALVLWPFFGAVLWGTVIAVLFTPFQRRLSFLIPRWRNLTALATVLIILVMVILPLTLIVVSLVGQAIEVYERIQSGEIDFKRYFQQVFDALPAWASNLLDRFDLTNLREVQKTLSENLMKGGQFFAVQALNVGQITFEFIISLFVMLYLLFFLLRDGETLARLIEGAMPLRPEQQRKFLSKFTVVIRATVKGNIVVALVQGALGGLIFWFLGISAPQLWGALMAVFSLLPAIGAGIVWAPVAVYFLATGAVWQAVILTAYGLFVIGLVDNVLRPILVGKDTKMPDYIVLISTLGGIAVFGVNGFVIGPVIAAMFIAAWDIFSESEFRME